MESWDSAVLRWLHSAALPAGSPCRLERSVMSNYVLCYNTATQGGLNGSFQLLPDCCCVNRSKDPFSWHSSSLPPQEATAFVAEI